ncbi:hypothetical protein DYBT9623_03527 [Dyadobacter sp. CECT 9623]|uniref:RES domain-containing protein n=1 Tax=Dyadobacter linearis TaxID=2823330 RepID=A0ABN7RF68_9BACT|nr:hypothetical protein DYBT9623_03527 [Dyadobacter sp. CECT 9623]
MFCSANCFTDQALKDFVGSMSTTTGLCQFSNSTAVPLIHLGQLADKFDNLLSTYALVSSFNPGDPHGEPVLLFDHILSYWPNLFNRELLNVAQCQLLLQNIARESANYSGNLFVEQVYFNPIYNEDALVLGLKWDVFANEIKSKNRFFLTEKIDTDTLGSVFERLNKTYLPGSAFYRGRISDTLLPVNKMGKPPMEKTGAGRANPVGIPYLYISSDPETTLYETRISLHETITLGDFVTNAPVSVVSLKNVDEYGPFDIENKGFTIDEFIRVKPYLLKLGSELSKPVRKQDSDLDYLPTQFLCEFIKSIGFDAVEYRSAMNPSGFNLAVFNDHKLTCIDTRFYRVNELQYTWEPVTV